MIKRESHFVFPTTYNVQCMAKSESLIWPTKIKNKTMRSIPLLFLHFEITKAVNFICVLSRVNTVTFNDVTVDIDLSVYGKSFAETMAGKRKQMSTSQKQLLYLCSRME